SAVRVHAVGAGFKLALASDLRVVGTDASFAMLEARYGLIPDLGGIHHLARLAGPAVAKELVWTARAIEASEAERLGLATRVVDPTEVEGAARDLARSILAHSPTAVDLAKELVNRTFETPFADELEREAAAQARALQSEHHAESVAAFVERRP